MLVGVLCSQTLSLSSASAADTRGATSAQIWADDAAPDSSSLPVDMGSQDASEEREGTDDDDPDDDFDDDAQPLGAGRAAHRLIPQRPSFGQNRLLERWTPVHLCLDPRPPRHA